MLSRLALIASLLCCSPLQLGAQQEKARWQRVYTGDDSVIELNALSITFEPERIVRATYRTVLTKPERLPEKSGTTYKSRLETIAFSAAGHRYRFEEVSWLDSSGKLVNSYQAPSNADWRVFKAGGIMDRMFSAISASPPFGNWKVLAYRFGDGPAKAGTSAPETAHLINTRVGLNLYRAEVGGKTCLLPAYQSRRFTQEELSRELEVELKALGIISDHAESIIVKCEGKDWQPPQSLLIQLPDGGWLILWEGLFLTLGERSR
jgi:hypothetical protein